MKTIAKLASEITNKSNKIQTDDKQKRLAETLNKFSEDFKDVIYDLRDCNVKYEPCFWFRSEFDGQYHIFPTETRLDLTMNGGHGGTCICNSIHSPLNIMEQKEKKDYFTMRIILKDGIILQEKEIT